MKANLKLVHYEVYIVGCLFQITVLWNERFTEAEPFMSPFLILTEHVVISSPLTEKKRQKIIRNGFIYIFQKDLVNEARSYECELKRKGQCNTKIKLDLGDNIIAQLNEYTHSFSQVKVELTKVKSRIKNTLETSEEPPQRNIANEIANISATTMTNLPRRENLGRTIRHQRNHEDRHEPPNPEIRADIPVLLLEYQLSENGKQFLLFDSDNGDDDRILIFGTD